ncbi:MAG: hypothetical protein H6738_05750 [Alphaproteobacteria bacterium]|nr:hypothetical protein [Alphaproteobacteria bacterium]MCB9696270.1 hypothetical protein [Alphaproteobacteria bacterium]
MSIPAAKMSFYVAMAQDHLLRQLAIYEAAHHHLGNVMTERAQAYRALMGEVTPPDASKVRGRAGKAALVGLKTEFELFVKILTAKVVHRAVESTRERGKAPAGLDKLLNDGRKVQEFAKQCIDTGFEDPILAFIEQAVPRHGLDQFMKVLSDLGLKPHPTEEDEEEFRTRFPDARGRVWNQVQAAFAVRHAIEHAHGRITARELRDRRGEGAMVWLRTSTWSRHVRDRLVHSAHPGVPRTRSAPRGPDGDRRSHGHRDPPNGRCVPDIRPESTSRG